MRRGSSTRFILWVLGALLAFGGAVAAFNFVIDPLQFYRVPTLYKPVFWVGLQRYQVATLARRYAEKIIVIGQSTTENFLPSDILKSWGKPGSKLSISGSTAHEQFLAARMALRTGRVTDVLWGVDAYGFSGKADRTNDTQAPFPGYLYETSWTADLQYLVSAGTLRLSLMILTHNALSSDLEHYHTWYDRFEFGAKAVLAVWGRDCAVFQRKYRAGDGMPSSAATAMLKDSIERNVLSLARQYPEVTFHLFLPPYSLLFYMHAESGWLPSYLHFRSSLAQTVADQPNIRLYDFQIVNSIVENLDNYKDQTHFGLSVTRYIIDAIRDGRHRFRLEDADGNNRRLIELVNRYDLCQNNHPSDQSKPE